MWKFRNDQQRSTKELIEPVRETLYIYRTVHHAINSLSYGLDTERILESSDDWHYSARPSNSQFNNKLRFSQLPAPAVIFSSYSCVRACGKLFSAEWLSDFLNPIVTSASGNAIFADSAGQS
jgi:hypothetical protein